MAISLTELETLLLETFPQAKVTVTDLAGDGNHYAAEVIDESFRGKNRVQQQRAVYAALKGKMDGAHGELHALVESRDAALLPERPGRVLGAAAVAVLVVHHRAQPHERQHLNHPGDGTRDSTLERL